MEFNDTIILNYRFALFICQQIILRIPLNLVQDYFPYSCQFSAALYLLMFKIIADPQQTTHTSAPQKKRSVYTLYINKQGLREGNHIKQRVKSKYLQHYKDKFNIKSIVNVKPPTEDNLARLTTKQLDDYIQIERNRFRWSVMSNSRKRSRKIPKIELNLKKYSHINVFRSSFLAKINKKVGEQTKLNQKTQQLGQINFTHNDNVIRRHSRAFSTLPRGVDDEEKNKAQQKSVASVGSDLEDRQDDSEKRHLQCPMRAKTESNLEWFEGMSRQLIKAPKQRPQPPFRGMDLDKSMNKTRKKFRIKSYISF